jgi:hypothetical protein
MRLGVGNSRVLRYLSATGLLTHYPDSGILVILLHRSHRYLDLRFLGERPATRKLPISKHPAATGILLYRPATRPREWDPLGGSILLY